MSAPRPDEGQGADDPVTLLIRHRVRPAQAAQYEAWLRRIVGVAQDYPGHLGVDVIRSHEQGAPLFTSVLRFTGPERLQHWLGSEVRRQLVTEVAPLLRRTKRWSCTRRVSSGSPLPARSSASHRAGSRPASASW